MICQKCNGTGIIYPLLSSGVSHECDMCNGKKVIDNPVITRESNADNDFSLDHYREILNEIKKTHKTFCFRDIDYILKWLRQKIGKFVIMRHDVEFSMEAAVRLAEIDAEYGIQSTFFLLQTSEYNPFEEQQAKMVRKIINLGHDIGLHYDAGLFKRLGVDMEAVCKAQVLLFETFFNIKIHAMSMHEPMRAGVKPFALPGILNTYDKVFMADMKYLSDSNQAWREGVVTKNLAKYDHIHLLTHEYIWSPGGWNWSALLFVEAQNKFAAAWKRAERFIDQYRHGFTVRAEKDKKFKSQIQN